MALPGRSALPQGCVFGCEAARAPQCLSAPTCTVARFNGLQGSCSASLLAVVGLREYVMLTGLNTCITSARSWHPQRAEAEYKKVTDEEKKEVVGLGGLHVVGTERHVRPSPCDPRVSSSTCTAEADRNECMRMACMQRQRAWLGHLLPRLLAGPVCAQQVGCGARRSRGA